MGYINNIIVVLLVLVDNSNIFNCPNAHYTLLSSCTSLQRLVSIYKSGKDISLDDENSPKTPGTPLQANGKSPSPSAKHFHTLPHPPKSKSQLKETSV